MISRGLVEEPRFSFRMGPSATDGGEVVFGGVDPAHYTGPIDYFPVTKQGYWEIGIEQVTLGNLVSRPGLACPTASDHTILSVNPDRERRRRHRHWDLVNHGAYETCYGSQ